MTQQHLPTQHILISGASIAGLTLAYYLKRNGFQVTVVELGEGPRLGGSPIDVRGQALEIAKEMGILPQIQAAQIGIDGMTFVNAAGETVDQIDLNQFDENVGEDIELRRDILMNILYQLTNEHVEFLFQNSIQTLTQDALGVEVTFTHGKNRRFDLVVGADGLHSAVRRLTFGKEDLFVHHLGLYVSLLEIDHEVDGQKNRITFYRSPAGRTAGLSRYPDQDYAMFIFRSPKLSYNYHSVEEKKQQLIQAFTDEPGWEVPKLLDIVKTAKDLYFDEVSQVRMPTWSKGRVALIGDAAHCAAFLSGMGSTLAMVGASILANELTTAQGDYQQAFTRYEQALRPLVEPTQARVPEAASMFILSED